MEEFLEPFPPETKEYDGTSEQYYRCMNLLFEQVTSGV